MTLSAPRELELSELAPILAACGDAPSGAPLTDELLDVSFYALGYDSLLVLQATEIIASRYALDVPDSLIEFADTPRMLIDIVNSCRRFGAGLDRLAPAFASPRGSGRGHAELVAARPERTP